MRWDYDNFEIIDMSDDNDINNDNSKNNEYRSL